MNVTIELGGDAEAWTQRAQIMLSICTIAAAIGLAWWQDQQRRKDERQKERVARLAAVGLVRLAVGHITVAANRCQDPIERARIAGGFPFYAIEQADQGIANFPVQLIGHEDGVEMFIGFRALIASARMHLEMIHVRMGNALDPTAEIGFLVNEARMMREQYRRLRELLAPGSRPLDAEHPAEQVP